METEAVRSHEGKRALGNEVRKVRMSPCEEQRAADRGDGSWRQKQTECGTKTTPGSSIVNKRRRRRREASGQSAQCYLSTGYMLETTAAFECCNTGLVHLSWALAPKPIPVSLRTSASLSLPLILPLSAHNAAAGQRCVSCVITISGARGGYFAFHRSTGPGLGVW